MKVLVIHPWIGNGGSEAVAAWCLDALQSVHQTELVTASEVDFQRLNNAYGTRLDPSKIRLVRAPRLPGVTDDQKLVALQHAYFGRFVAKIAPGYQAAVSCYNPLPLPIPTAHLVADFSWDEDALAVANPDSAASLHGKRFGLRKLYLALARRIYPVNDPMMLRKMDLVVANSEWTKQYLWEGFGLPTDEVLSPPIPLAVEGPVPSTDRDPNLFVCMGRISVEKRLEAVIQTLAGVRASGFDVKLVIAGGFGSDPYSQKLRELCEVNSSWVETPGFIDHEQKRALLSRATYALHACEGEAFGIVVGEYLACGCIPFVPTSGGAQELVEVEACRYVDRGQAVDKIIEMMRSESLRAGTWRELALVRSRVSPEAFTAKVRKIVLKLEDRASRIPAGKARIERLRILKQQMANAETVELPSVSASDASG